MSGVVVENNLNGGIGGVGRVKQLEELDGLASGKWRVPHER
jgi:hypothetical protein